MPRHPEVIVIGGGIIGLSIAWELQQRQVTVVVLERGLCGGQASGAAAGMLAPLVEASSPGPFLDLGIASRDRYPQWAASLWESTGIDIELTYSGILRLANTTDQAKRLRERLDWLSSVAPDAGWCDENEIRAREPGLLPGQAGGLWLPSESHVKSSGVVAALRCAVARSDGIVEGQEVTRIVRSGSSVEVQTIDERWQTSTVVVAAGAWSGGFEFGETTQVSVRPIRGQILALSPQSQAVRQIIYSDDVYLVPKQGGEIIVGATEDDAGFDARPTAAGIGRLLMAAPQLVPALKEAAFVRAWAGLRPATADHLPILGALADNLFVAAGHYRNGVLLAPITGSLLADLIVGQQPTLDLAPFSPDRFTAAVG